MLVVQRVSRLPALWRYVRRALLISVVIGGGLALPSSRALAGEGTVRGIIRYEKVPFHTAQGLPGLQRDKPVKTPAGAARVELVTKADNKVLGKTTTGEDGSYQIPWKGEGPLEVFVRAYAKTEHTAVHDFAEKKAGREKTWSSVSPPFTIAQGEALQDILARENTNEAGAFNILAAVHRANNFLRAQTGQELNFPPLTIYWGPGADNFTHFEAPTPKAPAAAYVLGQRDIDADEFDDFVIIHEYGHYVMRQFSRDDSPGGSHGNGERVDPRLAWSEGWANFFASAVLDDSRYVDTQGKAGTGRGLTFDLDEVQPRGDNPGYWSEHTVGSTLWHLFAKRPGGLHLGIPFKDFWTVLTGPWKKYPQGTLIDFCDLLVDSRPDLAQQLPKVLAAHKIAYRYSADRKKAPSVAGYRYLRPLVLGAAQEGVVDSYAVNIKMPKESRYLGFGGADIYHFTLDKKTKVRLTLDILKTSQPEHSELTLVLSNDKADEKGRIAPPYGLGGYYFLEQDLEPGQYFVEVSSRTSVLTKTGRTIGTKFNTGAYRLLATDAAGDKAPGPRQSISVNELQAILKDLGVAGVPAAGSVTIRLGKFQAVLQCFDDNKTLVIGCNSFMKAGAEKINKWNDECTLSRAIGRPQVARLEADLNCDLGVTPAIVNGFLQAYLRSLQKFEKFLADGSMPAEVAGEPPPAGPRLSPEQLRTILRDFGYKFAEEPNGSFRIALGATYQGTVQCASDGRLLTAFADFQKVGMDSINQWNDLQSLCRAILRPHASRLQADLNCDLGITPLTVHRFLQKVRKSLQQFEMALAPVVINDFAPADVERFITEVMDTKFTNSPNPQLDVVTYMTPDNYFNVTYDRTGKLVTFSYDYASIRTTKKKIDEWNSLAGNVARASLSDNGMLTFYGTIRFDAGLSFQRLKEFHDLLKKKEAEFLRFLQG